MPPHRRQWYVEREIHMVRLCVLSTHTIAHGEKNTFFHAIGDDAPVKLLPR